MTPTLYELTGQMAAIEDYLQENGGELTPELEEIWEETAESLPKKVDGYNQVIKTFEAYAKNLDEEIKRLQALKKTADNSAKRVKAHVKETMELFGLTKLDGNYCKMSISSSTSTDVDEETVLKAYRARVTLLDLPAWISVDFKVNKTVLKDTFKDKDVTPAGVSFVKNTQLRIR